LLLVVAAEIGAVIAAERQGAAHCVVFPVNSDDPAAMRHAVSNSISPAK
jgi:hypothetical protein